MHWEGKEAQETSHCKTQVVLTTLVVSVFTKIQFHLYVDEISNSKSNLISVKCRLYNRLRKEPEGKYYVDAKS